MKRTALILLTAIYLISCMGLSVTRSYCCDKLVSVSLSYGAADNIAGQSGKPQKCCGHEKQSFKVKDNHVTGTSLALSHPLPTIIPSFIRLNNEPLASLSNTYSVYRGNAPPGHPDIPAYTLYCTYLI